MSVLDKLKGDPVKGPKAPREVEERQRRGREAMLKDAGTRRMCLRFDKGDHYWYVNEKGRLAFQDTITHSTGGGKPPHRIRNRYNFAGSMIDGKVSAATQRVPSYEVTPTKTDPDVIGAARMAEKVALYGYDQWAVRRATLKAVRYALVCGEGFIAPYFDPNVGPFTVDPETEEVVGEGEIKLRVLNGNEVYWEPGCDFEQSPWHVIEQARPKDEVEQLPGYVGGKLVPDATTSEIPTDRDNASDSQMVLVSEYLERPCPKYPEGRKLVLANHRVILPPEPYPCVRRDGKITDTLVIHRISWTVDGDADHDRGLMEQLIDLQRTINDCWNKTLEWKNRCLNPQGKAPRGSNPTRRTDEPGAITYYNVVGGQGFEWETPPQIPGELRDMREDAIAHMRALAADTDIQAEADVAARTVQAAIEQGQSRWQSFIGDLAQFHSRVMRHCLYLCSKHYAEPRLLHINGRFGPEVLEGFLGADLMSQIDVRVAPGSLEVRSKQQIEQKILAFADRQWITPHAAMAAINGGYAEKLVESFELDVGRANLIIQKIKQGPDALFGMQPEFKEIEQPVVDPATGQPAIDPMSGQPAMQLVTVEVPGWMPREVDSIPVHKQVFSDWMKSADWNRLEPGMREAARQYWRALQQLEAEEQARQIQAQNAIAESQGMRNAAKEQGAKPMPDQNLQPFGAQAPPNAG